MADDTTWIDQPEFLKQSEKLCGLHLADRIAEVRLYQGRYYVTIGNLFGSQTFICDDATVTFRFLDLINRMINGLKKNELPPGVKLVEAVA